MKLGLYVIVLGMLALVGKIGLANTGALLGHDA